MIQPTWQVPKGFTHEPQRSLALALRERSSVALRSKTIVPYPLPPPTPGSPDRMCIHDFQDGCARKSWLAQQHLSIPPSPSSSAVWHLSQQYLVGAVCKREQGKPNSHHGMTLQSPTLNGHVFRRLIRRRALLSQAAAAHPSRAWETAGNPP